MSRKIKILIGLMIISPFILWASFQVLNYSINTLQQEILFTKLNDISSPRIVYHSYDDTNPELGRIQESSPVLDNSYSELLIITPKTVFLLKDGFDDFRKIEEKKKDRANKLNEWNKNRLAIKELVALEIQRRFYEKRIGPYTSDVYQYDNLIDKILREKDPQYRILNRKTEVSRSNFFNTVTNFGVNSVEARNAKKQYLDNKEEMKLWVEQLRNQLASNASSELSTTGKKTQSPQSSETTNAQKNSEPQNNPIKNEPEKISPEIEGKGLFKRIDILSELKYKGIFTNKPDGVPDYIAITNPGEIVINYFSTSNNTENPVKENFNELYQNVRKRHIQRFVNQYYEYLFNPNLYGATIEKKWVTDDPLCRFGGGVDEADQAKIKNLETKTTPENLTDNTKNTSTNPTNVKGKFLYNRVDIVSLDLVSYTAIDCEGNGNTRTFLIHEFKGLSWFGRRDMPNIISIFNNQDPEIQLIISKLVSAASQGSPEYLNDFKKNQVNIINSIQESIARAEGLTTLKLKLQPKNNKVEFK